MHGLQHERSRTVCHGCNHASWAGTEAGGLGVDKPIRGRSSRIGEVGTVFEHVAHACPVPGFPTVNVTPAISDTLSHVFEVGIVGSDVVVSLTVDSGVLAPSNRVHLPLIVIVVHHMEGAKSTSAASTTTVPWSEGWNSLHKLSRRPPNCGPSSTNMQPITFRTPFQ